MSASNQLSEEIDRLLESYLHLLDEYTILREQLSKAQVSLQQNLARANFTAERGVRYGKDHYDERMQATMVCKIDNDILHVRSTRENNKQNVVLEDKPEPEQKEHDPATIEETVKPKRKLDDPLRMFGILTPPALRLAQVDSMRLVEQLVPRIVNVNKEMEKTEIEIRRARKRKAKAEASSHNAIKESTESVACAT